MHKCPYCGEPVESGQERCFACGRRLTGRRGNRRKKPVNPLIFVAAGIALIVAVIGIIIAVPKQSRTRKVKKEKAKIERVRDSVRRANRKPHIANVSDKEIERLKGGLGTVEFRFNRVYEQTVGKKPTGEQQKITNQFRSQMSRLKSMIAQMATAPKPKRSQIADSVRVGQRQLRTLVSKLARAPKNR
ncbi:hypothetical protein CH330_09800 [candidate division WOR-3 bacterium JGI_Cruoil_03_51_56]|uniref:Putative zinc-ribbon domain-containing protein n=1 Tax=candidate division WOR-3 bacterium JGI_Cruoil_03_51_56 TaxID=1973747 RepID=A0A235BNU7_UNCW3|nr:MAG: hypothetical protein CH330_09800 [candidate division WOR-3 bacterium JGI_Cruoil_03_51_56]